jgi:recombinational DNA repair protein (RecF pathway)
MKQIYEIFDEFENQTTDKDRVNVLAKNMSTTLTEVLKLTFHPGIQWRVKELPENYKVPTDVMPGITYDNLNSQLRRLYLFQYGHETADKLTEKRRNELLIQLLESMEPRNAEVVLGIFQKDQGVKGLTYKFVKGVFPNLLP